MQITVVDQKTPKPAKRLNDLWQKLQRHKQANRRLADQLDALVAEYYDTTEATERERLLPARVQLIERLIGFVPRKTLGKSYRFALCDWIHEELNEVMRLEPEQGQTLASDFNEALAAFTGRGRRGSDADAEFIDAAIDQLRNQAAEATNESQARQAFAGFADDMQRRNSSAAQPMFSDDELDDWLAGMEQEFISSWQASVGDGEEDEPDTHYGETEDMFGWDDLGDEDEFQDNDSADPERLFNESWLKTMFRKAARALHPDREQDPTRKQEKQALMAQLLAARDARDLATVFEIYTTHVDEGDLPVNTANVEQLSKMLEWQIENLQTEKEDIITRSPLHLELYESVFGKSAKKRAIFFASTLEELHDEADVLSHLAVELRNIATLKEFLIARETAYY